MTYQEYEEYFEIEYIPNNTIKEAYNEYKEEGGGDHEE